MDEDKNKKKGVAEKSGEVVGDVAKKGADVVKGAGMEGYPVLFPGSLGNSYLWTTQ